MHIHGISTADEEFEQIYQYYIAVSKYAANHFLESGIIEKERVKILYNGIEIEKFKRKLNDKINYAICTIDFVICVKKCRKIIVAYLQSHVVMLR